MATALSCPLLIHSGHRLADTRGPCDERRAARPSGRGTQERGAGPHCHANVSGLTLFGLGLPWAQSPFHGISQLPQRLPILHRQLYNEGTLISSPYIAGDATSQPITIVIYLYKRRTAAVAATGHDSPCHPCHRRRSTSTSLIESQKCPPRDSMTGGPLGATLMLKGGAAEPRRNQCSDRGVAEQSSATD